MKLGPAIKQEGLILHLDAGSYRSYPRSGNIWYDLSGNGHHAYGFPSSNAVTGFSDGNFPIWEDREGGRFYLDGSDAWTILTDMGTTYTDISIEGWAYLYSGTGAAYWADSRNASNGGDYHLWNYLSKNINSGNHLTANSPVTYQENSDWFNRWTHIVVASQTAGSYLWVNGEPITDSRLSTSDAWQETLGENFRIGCRYNGTNLWEGYYGNFLIYDHVLTDEEVLNNYNATKGRFRDVLDNSNFAENVFWSLRSGTTISGGQCNINETVGTYTYPLQQTNIYALEDEEYYFVEFHISSFTFYI